MRWIYSILIPLVLAMLSYSLVLKWNYHYQENDVLENGRLGNGTIVDRSDCERRHVRTRNKMIELGVAVKGLSYRIKDSYSNCPELKLNENLQILYKPGVTYAFPAGHRRGIDAFITPLILIAVLYGWFRYIQRVMKFRSLNIFR